MTTDVDTRTESKTPPPGPGEQTLQGIAAQAARLGLPQLQFNADYLLSSLLPDVPFDPTPYTTLSREELGLGLSSFWDQFDTNRREKIIAGLRDRGIDPLTGQPVGQPVGQSTGQPVGQSTGQPIYQSPAGILTADQLAQYYNQTSDGRWQDPATGSIVPVQQIGNVPIQSGTPGLAPGLTADEQRAIREVQEEDAAKQRYIQQAQGRYEAVRQTPLAKLTQSQIEQATRLLPEQQKAESALLGQTVAQSNLAKQYAETVAPIQLEQSRQASQFGLGMLPGQAQAANLGLNLAQAYAPDSLQAARLGLASSANLLPGQTAEALNYLTRSGQATGAAFDAEGRLRSDLTDLVTSGRTASPAQQDKIDTLYRNQLAQVESDLQRQREDAVRTLPDIATSRGLRLTSADMPDRWNLIGREYLRSANQAALGLSAEAARQSLDYPLQTAGLGLQQQYLTGQQTQRTPQGVAMQPGSIPGLYQASTLQPGAGLYPALQTSVAFGQNAQSQFPGYLNPANIQSMSSGTNAYNPFSLPFSLQGSVIGGSPFAVQAQNPLLQSRLSNTQGVGFQQTGGTLPTLQGVGGILSGAGSTATGSALAFKAFCWIAMTLYGNDSWKVPLLRWFISGPLSTTEHGQRFADWYRQHGHTVADEIKQYPEQESVWRRGFDSLVDRAVEVWKYSAIIAVRSTEHG